MEHVLLLNANMKLLICLLYVRPKTSISGVLPCFFSAAKAWQIACECACARMISLCRFLFLTSYGFPKHKFYTQWLFAVFHLCTTNGALTGQHAFYKTSGQSRLTHPFLRDSSLFKPSRFQWALLSGKCIMQSKHRNYFSKTKVTIWEESTPICYYLSP